jgi:hypothetical protein
MNRPFVHCCSALIALGFVGTAQAQQPPAQPAAQPAYPSAAPTQRVNRAPSVPEERQPCDELRGLERDECLRRDVTDDDRPAGVTTSMQERARAEQERQQAAAPATEADDAADAADRGSRPAKATPSRTRTAQMDTARESSEANEATDNDDEDEATRSNEAERTATDSLDPPNER